jgi:pentatricopeptide repeat protein
LNLADAVSFNTVMKGYLAAGDEETAQQLLTELSKISGQATQVSFHGLMNARVTARDSCGAWRCFTEMQASGVSPNGVTCAILLKGVVAPADAHHLRRILELIEGLGQPVDEVLLSSVVEACLRAGQLKHLAKFMDQDGRPSGALSAPTYGALIKSYGQARDVKRVWAMWREMRDRQVQPSQVTLGCLIEALVANHCAEEAWQLVQEMWGDDATCSLINTVAVSTLLKGFARQPDRVVAIYEEMRARDIQSNLITYNTILNAFAQSGAMDRAPKLLEDMKAATPAVEPDIVTYSTLIKGFCSSGDLDRALVLLEDMKQDEKHVPDEVLYNSLLDGCAKEQRVKDALKLIDDMRARGVTPSNYTLSMLVKLLGRCRMLSQAFSMVEDLTKTYSFRPNIQVYTCLIQACFQNRQHTKAVSLLDRLLEDGLRPDEKTYTALVRGCLQARQTDQAVKMTRRAYQDASPPAGIDGKILDEVIRKLGAGSEAAESLLAVVHSPSGAAYRKPQQGGKHAATNSPPWRSSKAAAGQQPDSSSGSSTEAGSSDSTSTAASRGGKKHASAPPWRRSDSDGASSADASSS